MQQLNDDINTIATRKADRPMNEITDKIEAYMKAVAGGGVKGTTDEEKECAARWLTNGSGIGVKMIDGKREWTLFSRPPMPPPAPQQLVDRQSFLE
jgi:hypothetical protein